MTFSTGLAATVIQRLITSEPAALANPYPLYAELREMGSAHYVASPWGGGSWHFTNYAEVSQGLKNAHVLSSEGVVRPPEQRGDASKPTQTQEFWQIIDRSIQTTDPPDHTRLRRLLEPTFHRGRIQALRPHIELIAQRLLDQATAKGSFNFVAEFAQPLPLMVMAHLLGLPEEDWPYFRELSRSLFVFEPTAETQQNLNRLLHYLRGIAAQRRETPTDDLISALMQATDRGAGLSDDELMSQLIALLTGGYDTTSAALGNGLLALHRTPGAWEEFIRLPDLSSACEELLRFDSPFQYAIRRATAPCDLGGQRIEVGDFVWLWLGSANHDPKAFEHPERLQLTRTVGKQLSHLAFGYGIHYCLGASLTRLELAVAFDLLRQQCPQMQVETHSIMWRSGSFVRALEKLDVVVTP